ncbi:MAG: hypothetical protein O7C75_10400 [Verrucomicrobia bacterium]|nr:hypothetical protein [Verrucomicrobiota bacterium]
MGRFNIVGKAVNAYIGRYQERLGIARSMRLAKFYNGIRYGSTQRRAIDAYQNRLDKLLLANDPDFSGKPRNILKDGWTIDRSGDFPFIEETLAEADRLIGDRGGVDRRGTPLAQTDYLFHLNDVPDLFNYPDLFKFSTSSEIIATVSEYMGMIPVFSQTRPKGIRVFESTNRFNEQTEFSGSQLYHLDLHDSPLVYAILLVHDIAEENGPWNFLPASVSEKAVRALNYQAKGEPYRVTDQRMYEVIDPAERIAFTGKRGDVLFLDSSRCFHYGSRNAILPGYRVMYAFTSHCRGDFTRMLYRLEYPNRSEDSELRKMVLGNID